MERRGEKERGGEEGRKERERRERKERGRKEEGVEAEKKGRRRRKEWMGERREMVKTFCSKLTHSSFGEEGRKRAHLRVFCTSSPATTAMVVRREAAHTPSRFSVFSSIPDTTTSGVAH